MGLRIRYYLDEIEINPPNNFRELEIELNYDTDGNQQALSINDWEFGVGDPSVGNDGMIMCRNQFSDQAGIGVVQGKPFKITIDDEKGKVFVLFDGYTDLWKAKYARGKITASAVQAGKIDWLNDYADSFTFEYLYQSGLFTSDYFVPVPYVIVKKQDAFEIITTLVTIFVLTDKIIAAIKDIVQLAANSANPMEMTAIVRFIIQVLYVVIMLASLIVLIFKLFTMLMPPVKYHNVMYVKDLFKIACDYMGLTFRSSILLTEPYSKMVIMPEKYNVTNNKGVFAGLAGDFKNNNEKTGYYKGTFGDLMRTMKTMFNAKIVIENGVLYFEPFDFKLGNNGIQVPYTFDNIDEFTLNHDEFYATMILSFLVDTNDRHTIQEYTGTSVQVTQTSKTTINQQMSLLRNLNEDRISFALAKQKTELTFIEKILSRFIKGMKLVLNILILGVNIAIIALNILIAIINSVIQALGTIGIKIKIELKPMKKIPPVRSKNLISNRIGMLKMESDYVTVPKIFLIDQSSSAVNTKLSSNNAAAVNAAYLWRTFHYFKSFVSIDGKPNNQHLLRESDKFPFSFEDYEQSLNNNLIFTQDGFEGRFMSLKFNPEGQYAKCSYRVQKQYLSNLKIEIYEPDGQ